MPATLAILSVVFVESIYSAAGVTDAASTPLHKVLSILVLIVVSALNGISTAVSTKLSGFFVVTKFVSILLIVIAALAVIVIQICHPERHNLGGRDWFARNWFANRDTVNSDGSVTKWDKVSSWDLLGHISTAASFLLLILKWSCADSLLS